MAGAKRQQVKRLRIPVATLANWTTVPADLRVLTIETDPADPAFVLVFVTRGLWVEES